jgi:hypothetical protein
MANFLNENLRNENSTCVDKALCHSTLKIGNHPYKPESVANAATVAGQAVDGGVVRGVIEMIRDLKKHISLEKEPARKRHLQQNLALLLSYVVPRAEVQQQVVSIQNVVDKLNVTRREVDKSGKKNTIRDAQDVELGQDVQPDEEHRTTHELFLEKNVTKRVPATDEQLADVLAFWMTNCIQVGGKKESSGRCDPAFLSLLDRAFKDKKNCTYVQIIYFLQCTSELVQPFPNKCMYTMYETQGSSHLQGIPQSSEVVPFETFMQCRPPFRAQAKMEFCQCG